MLHTIDFQVSHLTRALAAVRAVVDRPEGLLSNIGESLLRINDERHDQGLAPDGSAWAPLSPLTQATKRKPRMLYDHGDLLRFHYQVDSEGLHLSTTDWKAIFHHGGTKPYNIVPRRAKALHFAGITRKRVHHPGLPARPLVGWPQSDEDLTVDITTDHLTAVLARARLG